MKYMCITYQLFFGLSPSHYSFFPLYPSFFHFILLLCTKTLSAVLSPSHYSSFPFIFTFPLLYEVHVHVLHINCSSISISLFLSSTLSFLLPFHTTTMFDYLFWFTLWKVFLKTAKYGLHNIEACYKLFLQYTK